VAGIALGFAAQDSLANIISGILIFWDKPFVVGDWIEAEGQYGKVSDITLRSTRIRTPRNTYMVIPNKKIIDAVLTNHSKHGELRVDVPVGIVYKEDVPAARAAILEALGEVSRLRSEPAPSVVVDALGDSSVNLLVRVWIDEADQEQAVGFWVVEAAKHALDRAGIQIPFPHLQLFWDEVSDPVVDKLARLPVLASKISGSARP
jgi:small conductance mechanosensitive channel